MILLLSSVQILVTEMLPIFFLWLKYKGIDILPYSYVVKYYYANRMDIHRYTRMYDVTRDSWNLSFKFVEETANSAADDEESFVNRYILNEINQMVDRQ